MNTLATLRRVISILTICLISLLFIFQNPSYGKDRKKTLIIASVKSPVTMDPQVTLDGSSVLIWPGVYETLLNFKGATYEVAPGLAKSWEVSPDGLTYTFHLQQGVKFHDGTPFTAESIKFSLERCMALGKGSAYTLASIKEIIVLDNYTIRLNLKYPVRSFLSILASGWSPSYALNPKFVKDHAIITKKDGKETSDWGEKYLYDHMLGTGPYRFVRWDHGQQIVLEKFKDYWRGWSDKNFERIIIKYIQEPATANLMLQRGEVDLIIGLPEQMKNDLEKMEGKGVSVFKHPSINTYYLGLNCKKGPTADVRVRQAIAHAFPYEDYVNTNLEGHAKQMIGFLPSTFPGYNPSIPAYNKDLNKAKKLLADAGYPNGGFTIKYIWETGYGWKRPVAELLQENLKKLGIKMEIQELNNAAWQALLENPESAEHAYGVVWWACSIASPQDYLWGLVHTDAQAGNGWNWAYYHNPEVDERIDKIDSILDEKEWYENLTRIQKILYEEVPFLCLYEDEYRLPMRSNLKGFVFNGLWTETINFYDMWKE